MSQNENLLNSDKTLMLTEIIHNIVYHYQNNHSRVFQSGKINQHLKYLIKKKKKKNFMLK